MLEFYPKVGQIPPGANLTVSIKLTDSQVHIGVFAYLLDMREYILLQAYSGRVIVKFVAIKTRKLCSTFTESWDVGTSRGVAKKIIEIRNIDLFKADPRVAHPTGHHTNPGELANPPEDKSIVFLEESMVPGYSKYDEATRVKGRSQRESEDDTTQTNTAISRAEDLYKTVKGLNDTLKSEITRKERGSPRAMDRKINAESGFISRTITDDLASVETTPMSPPLFLTGNGSAIPGTQERTNADTAAAADDIDISTIGSYSSSLMPSDSPVRPWADGKKSFLKTSTESDVVVMSGNSSTLANSQNDVPLASSPVADVRMYRRHSPVHRGGIVPGINGPVGTHNGSAAEPFSEKHSSAVAISIPPMDNFISESFDSISEDERDNVNGEFVSRPVEAERTFNALVDKNKCAASENTGMREFVNVASPESTASDKLGGDDENKKVEIDKYIKMEEISLRCSEWRTISDQRGGTRSFPELLKDITNPALHSGDRKMEHQRLMVYNYVL